ncbi:hypothetical protein V7112_22370 [Bacillus sp. JJ1566]|uniref:hypothetical protein n=1 Tax=Bacillus sp. JJ1566 TaxID=3122961 RepID=UPI002FFFC8EB
MNNNQFQVELIENKLEMIESIHKECDTPVDWEELKQAPPPFLPGHPGTNQAAARKAANVYKPVFLNNYLSKM